MFITQYQQNIEFILVVNTFKKSNTIYTKRFQWHTNTYMGQKLKGKKMHKYIFYLHIFIYLMWSWKGGAVL